MITQAATGADCKSAVLDFVGASPSSSIMQLKDNEDRSMIYAYFLGLITAVVFMVTFFLIIEYLL